MARRDGWNRGGIAVFLFAAALAVPGGTRGVAEDLSGRAPKVLTSEFYPCSDCHERFTEEEVAAAGDFHEERAISGHAEPLRGCFDCHNANDMDSLRLVSGKALPFLEVDVLCGQCHGKIYQAWKAGAYGKRTGSWNGEKRYYSCSECHDPHQPAFALIEPDPPPLRPRETLRRGG